MKRIILIAAAFAALSACSKTETETVKVTEPVGGTSFEKGQTVTLNVNAGTTTKVTSELNADGQTVDFKWAAGDKIKVTVSGKDAEFTLKSGEGTSSASFEGVMPASGNTFDVQYPVTDPDIATQAYSSTEAIPHDMMKFTATECSFASPSFTLEAANAALRLNLWGADQTINKIIVTTSSTDTLIINPAVTLPDTEKSAKAFFIVVPAGISKFNAKVLGSSDSYICMFEPTYVQQFTAGSVLNMPAREVKKSDFLPGKFTVASGSQIRFSSGNLYAKRTSGSSSDWTWGFYDNQYEINSIPTLADGSRTATSEDTEMDLFTWGYGSFSTNPISQDHGSSFTDWGTTIDDKGTWRTLSKEEWINLMTRTVNAHSGEGYTYQRATINSDSKGVYGMIIYPDNYTDQTGATSYTSEQWTVMESAGCVFLPAAGHRGSSSVYSVNVRGGYWSSNGSSSGAYGLDFMGDFVHLPNQQGYAGAVYGYSVRLVSVVQ